MTSVSNPLAARPPSLFPSGDIRMPSSPLFTPRLHPRGGGTRKRISPTPLRSARPTDRGGGGDDDTRLMFAQRRTPPETERRRETAHPAAAVRPPMPTQPEAASDRGVAQLFAGRAARSQADRTRETRPIEMVIERIHLRSQRILWR